MFAVFSGCRQKLVKGNKNHDTGNDCKYDSKHDIVHDGHQDQPSHQCADRRCQAGQERVAESFYFRTGRLIDWNGYGNSLGNIVDCDDQINQKYHIYYRGTCLDGMLFINLI